MNDILFNDDAQRSLIQGVNLIGDAVSTTYGPNGRNVIIKGDSGIYITKDGATVARYVESPNPFISAGIDLIKGIATKTATDVGDGTTTATILARELVNALKENTDNPITINRELNKELKVVIDYLEQNKRTIDTVEDLIKVATLSTNNDPELGKLVAETYFKVTKDGVVNVETAQGTENSVVFSQGVSIESGFSSPYFINTTKNTCELENVIVGVFRTPITAIKEITSVCERAIREQKALLILAPKMDSAVLRTLIHNNSTGNLKSCFISSPGHGVYRETLLDDIENILGHEMVCEKAIISKDSTYLIGANSNEEVTDSKIIEIRDLLKNTTIEFDKTFNRKRLANYIGGIATIYVGGYSQVEIQEKKDRLDDAICAVKAAMTDGILPGGGFSLLRAAKLLDLKYLRNVLQMPNLILCNNVPNNVDIFDFWQGKNYKTNEVGDMYEMGIVDPFLVTKIALENAVSVASLILTNGCAIINTMNI